MPSSGDKVWTDDKVTKLISLYKENSSLWQKNHQHFRNKSVKLKAVSAIAKSLRVSPEDITKKWYTLRSQLNEEIRKQKIDKMLLGNEGKRRTVWKFFEKMRFICDDPGFTGPSVSAYDVKSVSFKRELINGNNDVTSSVKSEANAEDRKTNVSNQFRQIDEYDTFGKYIASELRQLLSEARRRKLKRLLQKAITAIGEEDDEDFRKNGNATADTPKIRRLSD